ncbi:glutamyl-tRNA amidotransferase [Mycobacterium sp. PS03-16]|uniref:glutamyl-tRNA amidotransferase n=1 Tax=Mycobacterium sp. PS03-16 TaxID=2559611 RepID=UPI001073A233|nr:glutamyl-tRNA amidotransferase [Mycobacterium sp. PS03-16]TFV60305.1 glutamyl-tRNA amidotransferase [Mycobacterium sp. PS03-16]
MITAADRWRDALRAELLTARKRRDAVRVSALRCALAAVDNAETPDVAAVHIPTDGPVAGSVAGLGATEAARRVLGEEEIRALLRAEVEERHTAAAQAEAGGFPDRADALRAEAAVLTGLLG